MVRVTFLRDSANAEIELNVLIGIVGNSLRNYVSYAVFALVFTNSSQFFSPRI